MGKKSGFRGVALPPATLRALKAQLKAEREPTAHPAKSLAAAALGGSPRAGRTVPEPSAAPQTSDLTAFLAAVAGAEPLGEAAREPPIARRKEPVFRPDEDALVMAELEAMCAGEGTFETHESEEALFGSAPGVSQALLDALRRGQYAVQKNLDLHGMTREQAHEAVARFVSAARTRDGASCVLIVTGRGRGSPTGLSVLRQSLPRWLSRAPIRPHVLAYATARPVDGGPGAFYVLLRRQGVPPFGLGPAPC